MIRSFVGVQKKVSEGECRIGMRDHYKWKQLSISKVNLVQMNWNVVGNERVGV